MASPTVSPVFTPTAAPSDSSAHYLTVSPVSPVNTTPTVSPAYTLTAADTDSLEYEYQT